MRAAALLLALALFPLSRASALGDDALVFVGPTAITYSYDGLAAALREAGATDVVQTNTWPGGELADDYRLVVVTTYEGGLDPAVGSDLGRFVTRGGGLVIVAEHDRGHDAGNALATAAGASARFEFGDTGGGCNAMDAALAHPLTTDANPLSFAWGTATSGGTVLYGEAFPLVTVEGTVLLAGDSDIFADAAGLGSCPVGDPTRQFYRNLYTELPDESLDMADAGPGDMDAGVGADAGGGDAGIPDMRAGLGDPCTSNSGCASDLCAILGSDSFCTQPCTSGSECGALVCDEAAALCVPPGGGGGGCQASGGAGASAGLLLMIGIGWRRRRPC